MPPLYGVAGTLSRGGAVFSFGEERLSWRAASAWPIMRRTAGC